MGRGCSQNGKRRLDIESALADVHWRHSPQVPLRPHQKSEAIAEDKRRKECLANPQWSSVRTMWGPLLVLGLMLTINPLRLGIILLVLSRPRPMQNLLVYWCGVVMSGTFYLLVPLIVLHYTSTSAPFTKSFAGSTDNPLAHRIAIGAGAVLLVVSALLASRSMARTPSPVGRHSIEAQRSPDDTSTRVFDPMKMPFISRLSRPADDGPAEDDSRFRRLVTRARDAWRRGSPWIAFLIGLNVMPADGVVLALALIVASGAAIGTQISAAIVFLIAVLAVEEIILISNLVVPARTQSALRWLHNLAVTHHVKFMAAILALVGVSLIVRGLGGF